MNIISQINKDVFKRICIAITNNDSGNSIDLARLKSVLIEFIEYFHSNESALDENEKEWIKYSVMECLADSSIEYKSLFYQKIEIGLNGHDKSIYIDLRPFLFRVGVRFNDV